MPPAATFGWLPTTAKTTFALSSPASAETMKDQVPQCRSKETFVRLRSMVFAMDEVIDLVCAFSLLRHHARQHCARHLRIFARNPHKECCHTARRIEIVLRFTPIRVAILMP
jgi:hypothetical protein